MIRSIFAVLVLAGTAQASVLVGSAGYGGAGTLFSINQGTGAATTVGPHGASAIGDLTSNPATGEVWGIKIDSNQLFDIDPGTGAASGAVNLNTAAPIVSIAVNPINGKMYGNTAVDFNSPFEALYEIDPNTGNCVFVGRILFNNVYAMGFANDGTLYGIADNTAQLISISTITGNGSLIGNLPSSGYFDMAARPEDGVMFVSNAFGAQLCTINLANAALTTVGSYVEFGTSNMVGLAFVPSPTSAALLGLGGLLAARRRR